MTEYTYFIQDGLGNIKIGKSNNPEKRLKVLQYSNSSKLILLLTINDISEWDSHIKFTKYYIRGEWFKPAKELLEFIERKKIQLKEQKQTKEENVEKPTTEEVFNTTTIQITKNIKEKLKNIQEYPRETYNSIILRLIKESENRE